MTFGERLTRRPRLSLSGWAWSLYEGGRDPYLNLVMGFVFVPYLVRSVAGGSVHGQSLIATTATLSGLFVAFTAPFLGSVVERIGPRKPFLFGLTAAMILLTAALWFAHPTGGGLSTRETLVVLGVIAVLFAYTQVIHNALLSVAVKPEAVRLASGMGLALANFFAVLALIFCLWAFVLPGRVGAEHWAFVPRRPLFGIDQASGAASRISAPIAAGLFAVFATPLFLFVPDARAKGSGLMHGLRQGVGELGSVLRSLRGERDIALFLLSRMFFTDGMAALAAFSGVLAAGVMRWGPLEMLVYAILLVSFAVIGGLFGAFLDGSVGPKAAIRLEIAGALVCLAGQLGMGRARLLYFWSYATAPRPLWSAPVFRTLPELVYLWLGFGVALFVTAQYASSRTLLTRLSPPEKLPALFGLYALSGTATAWLGSLLIKIATEVTGRQQAGFVPIAGLLALGLLGMLFVRGGNQERCERA